jgi:hypothetical protein
MRDKWAHCLPDVARLATFWLPRRDRYGFSNSFKAKKHEPFVLLCFSLQDNFEQGIAGN